MLQEEVSATGFELEGLFPFNRAAMPSWWLNGKVLRAKHFSRLQLKLFDLFVPLARRLDRYLPWPGLGLIAVARRPMKHKL